MGIWEILISMVFLMRVLGGAEMNGFASCNFPAVYIFGDSNSDTGGSSAALDPILPPNGQTFFGKPSGRICDGRLIIDFIAEELGLEFLSPYLDSVGSNFTHGANFAIAGSTIALKDFFHLPVQIKQYSQFKARTIDIYNQGKNTNKLPPLEDFSKALYIFDIGQNDLHLSSMPNFPPVKISDMINEFVVAVQSLYNEGARVFWIHNVGPNGCMPVANGNRTQETFDKNGCFNSWNERVMEYNKQLKEILIKLRTELPEAAITYVDVYAAKYNLINNAKNLGFTDPLKPCVVKSAEAKIVTICENPSTYISWDGVHYTEAANHLIAKRIIGGSLSDPPVSIAKACHRNVPM